MFRKGQLILPRLRRSLNRTSSVLDPLSAQSWFIEWGLSATLGHQLVVE